MTIHHIRQLARMTESPPVVASILTIGCLINRRKPSDIVIANAFAESSPERAIRAPVQKEMKFLLWTIRVPDNARYRMRLTSRFLAMFPFLMEVWYWLLTWVLLSVLEWVELTRMIGIGCIRLLERAKL